MNEGQQNLERIFKLADDRDIAAAKLAYRSYRSFLKELSRPYRFDFDKVVAAFVSLSPNADYIGNLRSLVTCMEGVQNKVIPACIVVSTYNHCKLRALAYLGGQADFLEKTRGLKILNFYHNLLYPDDPAWATIDGHVVAAYRGNDSATMKQALIKPREYQVIKQDLSELAVMHGLLPNQYQAAIWFARKRHLRIKYNPQYDIFSDKLGISWEAVTPFPFLPAGQLSLGLVL